MQPIEFVWCYLHVCFQGWPVGALAKQEQKQ